MGKKKEKSGKKGALWKLSKCLFFWGSKHSEEESKQETSLKKAHSESSVDNTQHKECPIPSSSEQDIDAVDIGECSGGRSHFHVKIDCEVADIPEVECSENITSTDISELEFSENIPSSAQELKDPTGKNTTETNKLDRTNGLNDTHVNNPRFERFVVTSVSEENKDCDSVNKLKPEKSENTSMPNHEKKTQDQPLYQSKFKVNDGKNEANEQNSKAQACQPNLDSINSTNDYKNVSKAPLQHSSSTIDNTISNDDLSSEAKISKSIPKTVNDTNIINQQPEQQFYPTSLKSVNCTNMTNEKSEQIFHQNSISANCVNEHHSESKTSHLNGLDNHINTIDGHATKSTLYKSSHSSIDNTSDLDENIYEPQSLESKISSENSDTALQQSGSQDFLPTYISGNLTSDIDNENTVSHISQPDSVLHHCEPQICQGNNSLTAHTKTNDEPISQPQIDQADFNLGSTDSITDIIQIEVQDDLGILPTDQLDKNEEATDSTDRDLDRSWLGATPIQDSFESTVNDLSSDSDVDFDHIDLSRPNKSVSNKVSNMPNEQEMGNHLNNRSLNSYCLGDDSQGYNKDKTNKIPFQAAGKNDSPLQGNYPSINGSSDVSMTYLGPSRENKSWKMLSERTTDINKSSEMVRNHRTQASTPNNKVSKKEENKSVQRNISANAATKHSRVPVRKSVGSEDIVHKISKLSTEIEEIKSSIEQKSLHGRPKSNSANRSRSKIPRKCGNDSLSPK